MNPEYHWVDNFCLKFVYLDFILFLHFSISVEYLDSGYDEYDVK